MPIGLKKVWEKGWKRNDASDPIFCIHFIDKDSGKLLFKYAPCYEDLIFWRDAFKELIHHEYKKLQKTLASITKPMDRKTGKSCSDSSIRQYSPCGDTCD